MGRMTETNEMFGRLKNDMPKELSGFINFSQVTKSDGAIDKKHKELILVALGVSSQCSWCISMHIEGAVKFGATKEEILDACKVIALKSKLGKLIPNQITEEDLKDNLYVSYFIPPDRIISINKRKRMLSFLLWDSAFSRIYFIEKQWNDLNSKELEKYFN